MQDTRFIKSIRLRNLLSFGPESEAIELGPLNVLIGPNGSGKTNFIEAISILQAAPRDIAMPFREGGGTREWIWKGNDENSAEIQIDFISSVNGTIKYNLTFNSYSLDRLYIKSESALNEVGNILFKSQNGKLIELGIDEIVTPDVKAFNDFSGRSQLSLFANLSPYSELYALVNSLLRIKIYDDIACGISAVKQSQKTDWPSDFLLESMSNFALVLHDLKDSRDSGEKINKTMRVFYERFESIKTLVTGGSVQILFYEKGCKEPIPAIRLSDGTLKFLVLLTILCHPSPPPLICIEEPETGLHPDIIPTIAELLVEASKRTQLIVTTHSDILVSALSEQPESILVCKHDVQGTHIKRLDKKRLKKWLENYKLGELWLKGEIGGNRW